MLFTNKAPSGGHKNKRMGLWFIAFSCSRCSKKKKSDIKQCYELYGKSQWYRTFSAFPLEQLNDWAKERPKTDCSHWEFGHEQGPINSSLLADLVDIQTKSAVVCSGWKEINGKGSQGGDEVDGGLIQDHNRKSTPKHETLIHSNINTIYIKFQSQVFPPFLITRKYLLRGYTL